MKQGYLIQAANAAVDQTSVEWEIGDLVAFSIEVTFTGAVDGTLTLQCSNSNSTYTTVSGSSTAVVAGSPASVFYDVPRAGYRFVRVFWDSSGSAGTITAFAVVKEPPIPRG